MRKRKDPIERSSKGSDLVGEEGQVVQGDHVGATGALGEDAGDGDYFGATDALIPRHDWRD